MYNVSVVLPRGVAIAKVDTCRGTIVQRKFYLFQRSFEQIMHKELSLALNMLKQHTCTCIYSSENSMKPDRKSIENIVDPFQLASSEAS